MSSSRVVLFRSLATLHSAGISLAKSFEILTDSFEDPVMTEACSRVYKDVASGHTFSSAMKKNPGVFTNFHTMLIRVGEQTGALGRVLEHLADQEESQAKLTDRMRAAVVYPTVVALVALVGLVLVPPYVLDGLFKVIENSGVEPPLLTRIVMTVSALVQSPWLWAVLLPVFFWLLPRLKSKLLSAQWRPFLLSLPGLGPCLSNLTAARFADALSLCQRAGLNIQRSLVLAATAAADPLLEVRIELARKAVEEGVPLAECLERVGIFSPMFLEVISSAQEAGRLEEMLGWTARMSEAELESALEVYADLMEPLILLVVGFIVGILVLATAFPMVSVIENL